jgi:diguanylate cyclase (GGDEF)-like protein
VSVARPHAQDALKNGAPAASGSSDSLVDLRDEARRERLLDMERRMRPYRTACYAILLVACLAMAPDLGWWWCLPLTAGLAAFAVADRFMASSPHPEAWVAIAWGLLPLLLGGTLIATGGPASPVVIWFAIPAVTLGVRFEPRGMAIGTAYLMAIFLLTAVAMDPAEAAEHRQTLIATAALVLSVVILSGALADSDRTYRRRSTLDPLTGLFNRNALEARLAELDGQPSNPEEGLSHALLLCDLDHFKRVNDRLGHAAGDAVLQDVAYTMRAALRAGDSIYRVGGEEILVILPGATREAALEVAERLCNEVRERRPVGVTVTISIGLAVSEADHVDTDDLIVRADAALYAAKAKGRDTVFVSGEPLSG